jgi:hypothetical protein
MIPLIHILFDRLLMCLHRIFISGSNVIFIHILLGKMTYCLLRLLFFILINLYLTIDLSFEFILITVRQPTKIIISLTIFIVLICLLTVILTNVEFSHSITLFYFHISL